MGQSATPAVPAVDTVEKKDLELAIGITEIVKLNFDFSPKLSVAREDLIRWTPRLSKNEIEFNGIKPGDNDRHHP